MCFLDVDPESRVFGRTGHSGAMNPEVLSHPLLIDTGNVPSLPGTSSRLGAGRRLRSGVVPPQPYTEVLQTIEELIGGGAMQIVQELFQRTGLGAGLMTADVQLEVPTGGPGGAAMLIDRSLGNRHGVVRGAASSVRVRELRSGDPRAEGVEFAPLQTVQRWTEEARLSHGKHLQSRMQNLCDHIVLSLLEEAREAARLHKEKEEKERAEREKAETEAEEAAAKERAAKEEAEKAAAAERETKEAAAREAAAVAEAEAAQHAQAETSAAPAGEDTEMADATTAAVEPIEAATLEAGPSTSTAQPAEGTSTAPERVTVTIAGNLVDITDTGIDPTFLEALPDDMREEVLNQHFREQRSTQVEHIAESHISPEFLDALPPEIRAEILREERLERSRRERQVEGAAPAEPADMGAADFIASLDPQLRQVVLLDSDEGILQTLPSHMIAEAGVYRGGEHLRQRSPRPIPPPTGGATSPRKPAPARDAIQLLERHGVTTLVRLLFFPQLSRKTILHKVLLNLCENSKSRTELFNVLLSILQDGTGDLALVDKSFSQLSVRTPKGPSTPSKASGKQKEPSLSTMSHIVPNEVPPDLVAQRCLEALTFIVGSNELSSLFFLTEHELPLGLKRNALKKGKGKEKQAPQSHYPIVLLLGLLDRQTLLKTPPIMEATANLLDQVTRPLIAMKNGEKAAAPEQSATQPPNEQTQPTSVSTAASSTGQGTAGENTLTYSRPR